MRMLSLMAAVIAIVLAPSSRGGEAPLPPPSRVVHVSPAELPGIEPAAQVRTLSEAAGQVAPGDTVLVHGGVYRESVTVEASGTAERPITFQAAPGEWVVVTGADRITDWRREDPARPIYSTPWPHRFLGWTKRRAHPDDDYHAVIGRCEQVCVENYLLRQVLDRARLARGSFYVDEEGRRLYAWAANGADLSDTKRVRVEASVRQSLWQSKGKHIRVRGLRFRYAANAAQHAAVTLAGEGCVLEDCVVEGVNSIGATFRDARGLVARRCVFERNGQMGFSAYRAHGLLLTECLVRENNLKGWNRGWEAGGNKIVLCRGTVFERCQFLKNRGHGVWFDIGNEACEVRHCLVADNENAGIFYEISYGLHAHDNVIVGNGFDADAGAWGAAAGISISSSPDCLVERNLLVGNREGLNYREQLRSTPQIDRDRKLPGVPVWNHDQVVRRNVLAYNRDGQTWGWFDVSDGRHWPAAVRKTLGGEEGRPPADIAAEYRAKNREGHPTDLTLETLKLTHGHNVFSPGPGQPLFGWGTTWKHHRRYESLERVREQLGLEVGSVVARPSFADLLTRDFRVPRDSAAVRLDCYPRGDVPGVRLGVIDTK